MAKFIPLILFVVFTNFGSQIMLKHGMTSMASFDLSGASLLRTAPAIIFNPWVIGGMFVMLISMASHLIVLSRVDLSYAYPFLGLSFVLTTLWGYFVLSEGLNAFKVMGVLLICGGVACVARS